MGARRYYSVCAVALVTQLCAGALPATSAPQLGCGPASVLSVCDLLGCPVSREEVDRIAALAPAEAWSMNEITAAAAPIPRAASTPQTTSRPLPRLLRAGHGGHAEWAEGGGTAVRGSPAPSQEVGKYGPTAAIRSLP
jgi:hypothetical protein